MPEEFSPDERARLTPYFTNVDRHVFALTNLPETVKGALFARYSRSAKSLRRLFLDEFAGQVTPGNSGDALHWFFSKENFRVFGRVSGVIVRKMALLETFQIAQDGRIY